MKRWVPLILMSWMVFSTHARADNLRFIFITTVVNEDFFKPVKKGMEDAAKMMGVKCEFTGTEGVDVPAQAAMVTQAVKDGYDGIALNIIDPKGFDEVVRSAMDAGVPVVAFNVDDHATPNARISAVNQRLYEAGRTLGKRSLEFLPPKSKILMTMHAAGVSALEDRLHGAQEALKPKGITWVEAISGNTSEASAKVITEQLKKHPDIRYVLCTGQADTEGAGLAIEEHFKGQGYQAAGFDLTPEILRLIKDGHIRFTIDQQPYIQGFFPVIQLTLLKRYGIMPSSMDAGAAIITAGEVDQVMELTKKHYR